MLQRHLDRLGGCLCVVSSSPMAVLLAKPGTADRLEVPCTFLLAFSTCQSWKQYQDVGNPCRSIEDSFDSPVLCCMVRQQTASEPKQCEPASHVEVERSVQQSCNKYSLST